MTYEEVTDYLFNRTANYEQQGKSGYKEGLDTMQQLDAHFGHPHKHFRSIHVAGTNGKGSVSHSLAALLQVFGFRVGLYTSPHLVDFRERIRVNGQPVSEDYVVRFVEQHKDFFDEVKPSFFEIATAMAFKFFEASDVDVAVVEVGLGGRLDSTNIIMPDLSVITNVSLDHTQLLGTSVRQIAGEKGGIIKPGVPVVIGEATDETRPVFEALADKVGAPAFFAEDEGEREVVSAMPLLEGGLHYACRHFADFDGELGGLYQAKNTNTILVAVKRLKELGYIGDSEEYSRDVQSKVAYALQHVGTLTGLMGRWQKVKERPAVVCDTGHNIGGWAYLSRQLAAAKCRQLHVIFGMVDDKDVHGVMELLPKHATYYFTKGSTKRAFSEAALKEYGGGLGLRGECYSTVGLAYEAALRNATADDLIFIGGSTYVVADFLKTCV